MGADTGGESNITCYICHSPSALPHKQIGYKRYIKAEATILKGGHLQWEEKVARVEPDQIRL